MMHMHDTSPPHPAPRQDAVQRDPEGTNLTIWTYNTSRVPGGKSMPAAVVYSGKSRKALWHHYFITEEQRAAKIAATIAARKDRIERKKARHAERVAFQHDFKVGDILTASYGYEQTNICFYEITGTRGKLVTLRQIKQKLARTNGPADYVEAAPGEFVGPEMQRKPGVGGYVRIDSVCTARKWDGAPEYQTALGYGH